MVLALAKLRPIKHFQAKVNDRGVQAVHFVSKLKPWLGASFPHRSYKLKKSSRKISGRTI